jgi:periplasmic protein TonB
MDRARAVSAPVSFGAHALGATILAIGPLLVPETLPAPRTAQLMPPLSGLGVVVALGQGGPLRGPRPVEVKPTKLVAPSDVAPISELPAADLRGPEEIIGPPGNGAGPWEPGLCVFDCGGPSAGSVGSSLPVEPERQKGEIRVPVGGLLRPPQKVQHVDPVYPPLAVVARVQGPVQIECVISTGGDVSELKVLRGHPLLDDAAVAAVSQWRYRPTMLNGVYVSVVLTVTVDFRLH